jgi:hypothetical protein
MGQFTAHWFPPEVFAVLVRENIEICSCCGQTVQREPTVIDDAPRHLVHLRDDPHREGPSLDRKVEWRKVPAGVAGWGLVDYHGRLLYYDVDWLRPRKGDTYTVDPER